MAIAHVCLGCGLDLARIRPLREPHYGLPLVRCPRCAKACVRRHHPLRQGWRRYMRADVAMRVFTLQLLMVALLSGFSVGLARELGSNLMWRSLDEIVEHRQWLVGVTATLAVITGVWFGAGLGHRPLWLIWQGWTIWIAALLSFEIAGDWLTTVLRRINGEAVVDPYLHKSWAYGLLALGMIMIVSLAGVPLGRLLRRSWTTYHRSLWRRRRRRIRAARNV